MFLSFLRIVNEHRCNCLEQIQTILEDVGEPINIFEFFINPNDFAQSVENLFYLSFLIRDGKAVFDIEDGVPVICKRRCLTFQLLASHSVCRSMRSPDPRTIRGGLEEKTNGIRIRHGNLEGTVLDIPFDIS